MSCSAAKNKPHNKSHTPSPDGGVGSNFSLAINGLSGKRVRYFIDGIPMAGYGSSFQINNISINAAERVEVYKGVVPI
jgi:outer membrane cobalamin receptor